MIPADGPKGGNSHVGGCRPGPRGIDAEVITYPGALIETSKALIEVTADTGVRTTGVIGPVALALENGKDP